jgi:D-alanine-D-alanine ligase
MSRSDFILKGSTFYILETNTIPGMTETSLLPQAAKATGITFPEMLTLIITAGRRRKVK